MTSGRRVEEANIVLAIGHKKAPKMTQVTITRSP